MSYSNERLISLFSGNNSTMTSATHLVQGFTQATVQSDEATSNLTLEGSNDDGFSASIVSWSALTEITVAGMYTLDMGYRWLRGRRVSADTDGTVSILMTK